MPRAAIAAKQQNILTVETLANGRTRIECGNFEQGYEALRNIGRAINRAESGTGGIAVGPGATGASVGTGTPKSHHAKSKPKTKPAEAKTQQAPKATGNKRGRKPKVMTAGGGGTGS